MTDAAPPRAEAQEETAPPQAARGPRRPSGAAVGAVLGGAGTLLAALFSGLALWGGNGGGDGSASVGGVAPPSPPAAPATTYTGYDRIADHTRAIRVEVPKEWGSNEGDGWHPYGYRPLEDGQRIGPGLNAAPNYKEWRESPARTEVPGVFIGASTKLAEVGYTPERLTSGYVRQGGCRFARAQPYPNAQHPDDVLRGRAVRWTCGESGYPAWYLLAATPRGATSPIVLVEMSLVSPRDEAALERVLATLDIDVAAVAAQG